MRRPPRAAASGSSIRRSPTSSGSGSRRSGPSARRWVPLGPRCRPRVRPAPVLPWLRRGAARSRQDGAAADVPPRSGLRAVGRRRPARASFRAEIYEWQIAALLATGTVDEAVDARGSWQRSVARRRRSTCAGSQGSSRNCAPIALDNAFGRSATTTTCDARPTSRRELVETQQPDGPAPRVEPERAIAYLDDLRSLWDVELPEAPEHAPVRREYELRRAQATRPASSDSRCLGPVIVEAKLSTDLRPAAHAGAVAEAAAGRAPRRAGRGRAPAARWPARRV